MSAGLALGTAQLGMPYGVANRVGPPDAATACRILDHAVSRGVQWLDTAPDYAEAESRVGAWLRKRAGGAPLKLSTKLPRLAHGLAPDALAKQVAAAIDGSRAALGVDCLDAYLLHAPGDLHEYGARLVDLLAEHRGAGRVGRIGVSVYAVEEVTRMLEHAALDAGQYPFNLFDRRFVEHGAVAALEARRCLRFVRSALLQGLLGMSPEAAAERVPGAAAPLGALRRICDAHGWSPVALALAFAAGHGGGDQLVVGVESVAQLDEVIEALARPVPPELAGVILRELSDVPAAVIDPRGWAAG